MKKSTKVLLISSAIIASSALAYYFYLPKYLIERAVKSQLNDPDSAKFSRFSFNRANGFGCGFVNSKNRIGGYVGDRAFLAHVGGKVIFQIDDPRSYFTPEQKLEIMQAQLKLLEEIKSRCVQGV